MFVFIEELLHHATTNSDQSEVLRYLSSLAYQLDFEHFAYGAIDRRYQPSSRALMINTYPKEWNEIYKKNSYILNDSLVKKGLETSYPINWEEVINPSEEMWKHAQSFGLVVGWSCPSHRPNRISSLISLSRSGPKLTKEELRHKTPHLLWFANTAEQILEKINAEFYSSSIEMDLTAREIEILKWSADGKTVCEISIILGIAERTITFHINNAIKKLGASNKTSASVKATILGII